VNSPRLKGHAANTFGLLSLRHSPLVIPPNQRSRFLTRFCSPAAPPAQTVDQADSALANPFHHVFDVVDDELNGHLGLPDAVRSKEGGSKIDTGQAVGCANGGELLVGEISRMWAQGVGVGMGSDERGIADGCDVPEPALVDVRKIDQNPEPVAPANQFLAKVGQAGSRVG
jgi:hypothetical protein